MKKEKGSFWHDFIWRTAGVVMFFLIYYNAKEGEKVFVALFFMITVFNIILLTKLDKIEQRLENLSQRER